MRRTRNALAMLGAWLAFAPLVLLPSYPLESQARAQPTQQPAPQPKVYRAEVVARYPHDPTAFTEGLLWHDGWLYESTGRIGRSEIRKVDLVSGKIVARHTIPPGEFGEGLALWKGELVSLTWRDGMIHRWRLTDLAPLTTYSGYPKEGWGLTRLDNALVASDGSSTLYVLDPTTYAIRRKIAVTLAGRPLHRLNELEAVDGMIYANVWMTGFIVVIDPKDGAVRKIIDLRPLTEQGLSDPDAVLNGIAWDKGGHRLFVTGKLWAWLYQIRLIPKAKPGK